MLFKVELIISYIVLFCFTTVNWCNMR